MTLRPSRPARAPRRALLERLSELTLAAQELNVDGDERTANALRQFEALRERAARGFDAANLRATQKAAAVTAPSKPPTSNTPSAEPATPRAAAATTPNGIPIPRVEDGVEYIEGKSLTLVYEGKRCIHARFCVTGAPGVFLANVKGPVDPTGRHRNRAPGRNRPRLPVGRDSLRAARRRAERERAARKLVGGARSRPVRGAR